MTGAPLSPAVGLYLIIAVIVMGCLWWLVDRANSEGRQ